MRITKRDAAVITALAVGTAAAVYFAAGRSLGGALVGLLVGAVGGIIPGVLIHAVKKK